ncbi:MAG TPA: ferritin-like fold-containing protein [Microbacteriaceae bacterium]|nr:ferritin-like fold-containing protein [Microbacteriaceae bacterium]
MASWFSRRRPLAEIPRLKPRSEQRAATRVDLHELAPDLLAFLGQSAYLQFGVFESLSRAASAAPDLDAKDGIGRAAGFALAKYQGLVAEIRRRGDEPAVVMQPFAGAIDDFHAVVTGADWLEGLLGVHVTAGLLDDFFIRLAHGLADDPGPRAAQVLGLDSGQDAVVQILRDAIAADPRLASRLAMWGRRLVGDTLLVARSALHHSNNLDSDEQRIEPIFTELIAAHTRRMDALGLTA